MAKEFLDSSASIKNTKENAVSQGSIFTTRLNRFALRALGSAGLALSPLIVACSPDVKAISSPVNLTQEPSRPVATGTVTPDKEPTATATISLTPGIGGGSEPIPTFPAGHPRAGENPGIDEANRKADEAAARATAQAGEKIPPEGTQIPKETQTPPEVEQNTDCLILKPEYCKDAVLIELPSKRIPGQFDRYVGINPHPSINPNGKVEKVELFAPYSGQIVKEMTTKYFNGSSVIDLDVKNPRRVIVAIGPLNMSSKTENKQAGEPFASIDDSDVNNFGYKLLVTYATFNDKNQEVTDDAALKKAFPKAYETPSKRYNTFPAPNNKTSAMGSPIYLP